MVELNTLEQAIRNSWDETTTSYPDDWTEDNPAYGQCAVTALVVQDYMGGELVWANVTLPDGGTESHYLNLIDGKEIDLTKKQFPEGSDIPNGVPKTKEFPTTKDYVLSYQITQDRYTILKERVEEILD